MDIYILGDNHGQYTKLLSIISKFDLRDSYILHVGDGGEGFHDQNESFDLYDRLNSVFLSRNIQYLSIRGNHSNPDFFHGNFKFSNFELLEDYSFREIEGIKFWGSPVTPRFFDWAFNRDGDIQQHWNMIPHDTNVLITHGPPYGILDFTARDRKPVGCHYLRRRLFDLKDLKVHSFGHIHEGFGQQIGDDEDFEGVHFINASYLNLSYDPVNHPVVINI
jgi:Icc-related predicted phosphoesterase